VVLPERGERETRGIGRRAMKAKVKDWTATMQQEWDARARENARYYIATDVPEEEAPFYASGRADYQKFARAFLDRSGFTPGGKTALEIGCGIGRMTRAFAEEFGEVIGADISPEMVDRARAHAPGNARFVCVSGSDLAEIGDASVDFAFSYIVFQHIPEKSAILCYIEEAGRVLRPGGLFRFHMNGLPHARIGGVLLEGYISESPKLQRLPVMRVPFVRRRKLGTWLGHPMSAGDVHRACRRSGLQVSEMQGRWTEHFWVGGRKAAK
jgi:SAM-dependent methyltransferase